MTNSGSSKSPRAGWRRFLAPAPAEAPVIFTDARQLEDWMAAWIAPKLGVSVDSIDRHAPFTDYGLDSMVAVKLSGQLEQVLRRPVSPAVAWEYPTIAEVAEHLMAPDAQTLTDLDAD